MKAEPKITVLGSNMIDLITNIHRMPKQGETVEAPVFDLGFGGKGANQAVAAALLGAHVTMVTKIGDDIFGGEVKRNFESFGIDAVLVDVVKGTSNGVAPIFVDEDGNITEIFLNASNTFLHCFQIGNVCLNGQSAIANLFSCCPCRLSVKVENGDLCPLR